jgi:hypothetical protein
MFVILAFCNIHHIHHIFHLSLGFSLR